MIIYDSTALAFIKKTEAMARGILTKIGYDVRRNRFLYKNKLYPIHVVVFEGQKLGYFDPHFWQIGLNRKLVWTAKEDVVRDILKHELAHYLTFIEHGATQPHGIEFHEMCRRLGFAPEIAAATANIEFANENKIGDLESERVLEKVKKLLQLAQSVDVHEAELATVRANEILLRYNLSLVSNEKENQDTLYMDRVFEQPRRNAKLEAVYDILKHFIVRPVLSHATGKCVLEVTGSLTNVKLARYVAGFLDKELENLWTKAQQQHQLRGLRAKNSFYNGVAKGFDDKMKASKAQFSPQDKSALVAIEDKLNVDLRLIYRRLSHSSSTSRTDEVAQSVGHEKGRQLSIRGGLESQKSNLQIGSRK